MPTYSCSLCRLHRTAASRSKRGPAVLPPAPVRVLAGLTLLVLAAASARATRPPTPDPTFGLKAPPALKAEPIKGASARWIWAPHTADNQVVAFRRDFSLAAGPSSARLFVTADNYFTAYVNGTEVGSSTPAPGGFEWKQVHSFDVTGLLHPGKNVLAVEGKNDTSSAAVLALLRVRAGGRDTEIVTDNSWKQSEAPGPGWQTPAFDAGTWQPAAVVADLSAGPWGGQLTGWPGLSGGASYLRRMNLPVKQIISVEPRRGVISGERTILGSGAAHLTMSPPVGSAAEADCPALVLDFGQETSGRVEVVSGSAQPVNITLRYGESEDEARNGPYTGVQKITVPPDGVGAGMDSAFRYAIVTVLSAPAGGAAIRGIRLNMDYYPVTYRGSFDSSDPVLNRVWYVGAYTAHLCMQQDIWDAPKRDRARWMGDLQVSGEVINNAFLDRFLMEQTMDRLRADAGSPPHSHVNGIPGYSCAWVAGMADFYRHTGDTAYILRHHDDLLQMLDFFRGEVDDRGLFANRRGEWDYADWSVGFNGGGPHSAAATHFYMIRMLRDAAWLLGQIGDATNAARCTQWADDATAAADRYLKDPTTATFGDRWQDNAMAVFSGAASPAERTAIWDQVLSHPYPESDFITPYYNNYDIFAMAETGHTPEALQFVRDYWGGMLAEGATSFWEGYDTRWPKEHFHRYLQADNGMGYFVSLSHGWSAGATSFLTERVLGVRSTGPGFRTVDIQPELCGLKWVTGTVPTPHGAIHVQCREDGSRMVTEADVPQGVTARFLLPPGTRATFNGSHFRGVTDLSAAPQGSSSHG